MNSQRTILIIEDHASVRLLLASILGKRYEVKTLTNGLDALSWLNSGNFPDLIVMDVSMPKLSGIELLENIRSSGFFGDLPVIIISGSTSLQEQQHCLDLGVVAFLNKPFNPIDLKAIIEQYFNQMVNA